MASSTRYKGSISSSSDISNGSSTSPKTATGAVRSPNPAKRVPNNPADELRSAVNKDALRDEARQRAVIDRPGIPRNVSAPVLTTTPPASPTAVASSAGRTMLPRNPSIDSTVSSNSSAVKGNAALRSSPESGPQDAASAIAEAGSPEAAIQKLLSERAQAASHNAQLWRLVEKQRTMILSLNKDLVSNIKDKERYKRKLKGVAQSESTTALISANQPSEEMVNRERSESPAVATAVGYAPSPVTRSTGLDNRKVRDAPDTAPLLIQRSDTPLNASNASSAVPPTTPQSAGTSHILRDIELVEAASASVHENRAATSSTMTSPNFQDSSQPGQSVSHKKHPSITSFPTPPQAQGSFSNSKSQLSRKPPPAPLNLSSQPRAEATARVTNNIIDPSDSEYDDDSVDVEVDERGRRKTREEDDHERDAVVQQESEQRSESKKAQSYTNSSIAETISTTSDISPPSPVDFPEVASTQPYAPTSAPHYQQRDPATIVRQHATSALLKSNTAPSLLSPGLPMSPRPGDRPVNSPMPRAPNKILNSLPMSPRSGAPGLPLSPRAPRQALTMPQQTPLSISSPHLARAEAYQNAQTPASTLGRELRSSPTNTPDRKHAQPMTPGEVYQGLVTDQYPDLLLPPNALPSIYVRTASSRMKPSRQSYLAPKAVDDNPVFTLSVHERSSRKQLWRVEKTFAALAQLDDAVKSTCAFRERLPDRTLFSGHAPAKIDARRSAIDLYFHRMLESLIDESSASLFCRFLSTDAISAERGEYFSLSVDTQSDTLLSKRPRREGYLTKRGKNFGGWKARYFVLDGPLFKYYDAEGGALLGTIRLLNAQIGKQSNSNTSPQEDEDNQFRHAFLVLEPKKKDSSSLVRHVLCAESDDERDSWVDALLQYVDCKEDGDDVSTKSSLAPGRVDLGPPRSPRLQKSLNDLRPSTRDQVEPQPESLRAVGYADVVAREAPVMGSPSQRKPTAPLLSQAPHDGNFGPAVVPSPIEQPPSGNPAISGLTNLQVISNAGDWGMGPPPTPQSKDKKRSIFSGFRGRSSSDLGSSDRVMPSIGYPQDPQNPGVIRAVFGAPLADAVRPARPGDPASELPAVVYRCIEYLLAKHALAEEGIFRMSGSNTVIKALKDRFNNEGDVNLLEDEKHYDIHAVASLLKLYLRELPSSILTRELHLEFLQCSERHSRDKVVALNSLVHKLPPPNRALLDAMSSLLLAIVSNADVNKMNIRNVGIVFAPTLNVPAPLISSFVEDQNAIFGPLIDHTGTIAPKQHVAAPAASTDLRSPRKQMFSDLPTPAYNQTTFQSLGVLGSDDTGMIPVHPTYTTFQVAPQGEGGFGSINDALQSPNLYNTVNNGVPSSRETKAKRRESALLGYGMTSGSNNAVHKKSSMSQLRDQLRGGTDVH